jgi:beta-1,4-mannosyltransferase
MLNRYERVLGRNAFLHLTVSHAMLDYLKIKWKIQGNTLVLHDKAPNHFRSLSETEKARVSFNFFFKIL